ncbi:MAG: GTP cyclohydrolase I FolE2 [Oligoflexales bacterium]|nr:GTP cyclohydrolase I FolE2 [Oligoflexales bacterium]
MTKNFPDIVSDEKITLDIALEKVGMSGICVPVFIETEELGKICAPASADAYVSLDKKNAKGIHMSRLYLTLIDMVENHALSGKLIRQCLDAFLSTHNALSNDAHLSLKIKLPIKRPSLKSDNHGWKNYQVGIEGQCVNGRYQTRVKLAINYSSTCPCSAALSRQLIQQNFKNSFEHSDKVDVNEVADWLGQASSINATPHGQRSIAYVTLVLKPDQDDLQLKKFIDLCEDALSTPVQAAVKREDEQEFARLSGSNLMFAEDAARKVASALESCTEIDDFKVEARHLESLHAHDAIAITTKGVPGGLQAHQSWD